MPLSLIAAACLAFALCWLFCLLLVRRAASWGLQDEPNHRSSHRIPTPRGGGIAIVAAFLIATPLALPDGLLTVTAVGIGVAAAVLLALVGLADDVRNLGSTVRLVFQAAAVLALGYALRLASAPAEADPGWISLMLGPRAAGLSPPVDAPWLLGVLDLAIAALLLFAGVWWLNLFNFMDGIDGIAGAQAIFMLGSIIAIDGPVLDAPAWQAGIVLVAATAGFLVWNSPPARLFMGDSGSLFLAFAVLALGALGVTSGQAGPWPWLILAATFVCDATVTLLRRLFTGQNVFAAHRSHLYQRLARRWDSHARVTLVYSAVNVVWLLPLAAAARALPGSGAVFWVIACIPLVTAAVLLGAGSKEG